MAPRSRRAAASPRHLIHRHVQRALRARAGVADKLPPGYEQLVSYYIPGLQGGAHTITVEQYVTVSSSGNASPGTQEDSEPKPKPKSKPVATTTQPFEVVAPQFSLPSDAIHSTYPPQGQQEQAYTLPHVIFNDPTLPWARHVGTKQLDWKRNQTPWLAVLVFTADEIGLNARYLRNGASDLFTEVDSKVAVAQGPTLAVQLPVVELANLAKNSGVASATHDPDDALPKGATTEMLFVKKKLFAGLFTKRNSAGHAVSGDKPYIYAHRFLAHRRDINTQGMAVAGAATSYSESGEEDDSGSFSVVFSSRTGPPDVTSPTVVYVHLVSLEGIEGMAVRGQWPIKEAASFVTLPSLYSWSYVCLPKGTADVRENFETLGANIDVLVPSLAATTPANAAKMADYRRRAAATEGLDNPDFAVADNVLRRIENGYSMARYRTQTGEVTACLMRGPLVPSAVPPAPEWWPATSMSGTDLHILDPTLGLMDLSYANAWQIGRCMALGDEAFTSALYRVRHQILTRVMAKAQKNTVESHAKICGVKTQLFKDKSNLLRSLPDLIEGLQGLGLMDVKPVGEHHDNEEKETHKDYMRCRWNRTAAEPPDLSYHGTVMKPMMVDLVVQAAFEVASTPCKKDPTQPDPDVLYDEYNTPFSTDWAAVLHWVLDRLCLGQIPAHNLVTDASHVPPESIRFFAIDSLWVATLVDGALSFGNHIDQEHDHVREAIKEVINAFLSRPRSVASYPYPIPRYGCFVRSKLVSQFPDLTVEAGLGAGKSDDADAAPMLLRHDIVGDGLMLCLFRSAPDPASFTHLTFTQPPHQQTFMAGDPLNDQSLKISYRKAFTTTIIERNVDPHVPLTAINWKKTGEVDPPNHATAYLWDDGGSSTASSDPVALRLLLMDNLADDYRQYLEDHMGTDSHDNKYFEDKTASSALMGYQCNNPSWILPIAARVPLGDSDSGKPQGPWSFPVSRSKSRGPLHRRLLAGPTRPTMQQTPQVHGGFLDRSDGSNNDNDKRPGLRHVRIFIPPPVKSPPPASRLKDADTFPQFLYRFWPASARGHASLTEGGSIPMLADGTPQDIVVSITRTSQPFEYSLQEIRIKLPLGPADDDDPGDPAFTEAYTGNEGRPAMLSNLRMTPLVSHAADGKSMYLRLIPRSISRVDRSSDVDNVPAVPAKMCAELSFVLPSVTVNVFKQTGPVNIYPEVVEIYPNEIPQTPLTPPVIVLTPA